MGCDQTGWTFHEGELDREDVRALLAQHLAFAHASSPREAVHALSVDRLVEPGVRFFSVREDGALLGVGALREVEPGHGEVKSMRTADAALRRGVARAMLAHLIDEARAMGWRRISLETGSGLPFAPANRLYEAEGFERSGQFGAYADNAFTKFYTRLL
ncbi:GNAT family N-acetyltransferase [Sphingomonas sp. ASV193]|uniref:GNAT family N-acetyltransferase n=1 Tax=Sphingomonas sp. ASV193 TaxID=3144405 RepID=UPI0032E9294E